MKREEVEKYLKQYYPRIPEDRFSFSDVVDVMVDFADEHDNQEVTSGEFKKFTMYDDTRTIATTDTNPFSDESQAKEEIESKAVLYSDVDIEKIEKARKDLGQSKYGEVDELKQDARYISDYWKAFNPNEKLKRDVKKSTQDNLKDDKTPFQKEYPLTYDLFLKEIYKDETLRLFFAGSDICAKSKKGVEQFTPRTELEIKAKYKPYKYTRKMLCKEYGVSDNGIKQVLARKTWKHI